MSWMVIHQEDEMMPYSLRATTHHLDACGVIYYLATYGIAQDA